MERYIVTYKYVLQIRQSSINSSCCAVLVNIYIMKTDNQQCLCLMGLLLGTISEPLLQQPLGPFAKPYCVREEAQEGWLL
jgi:hypothetical protein